LRQVRERVWYFSCPDMLVIALAAFVVEPQDAYAFNNEGESVFEGVWAAWNGLRQLPDHHFGELAFAYDPPFTKQ